MRGWRRILILIFVFFHGLGHALAAAGSNAHCLQNALLHLQTLSKDPSRRNVTPVQIGNFKASTTYVREQHKQMALAVTEFLDAQGHPLHSGSRMLEVGYGGPALLELFHSMTGGSKNLKGLDVFTVPKDWSQAHPALDLIQGHVPPGPGQSADRSAATRVTAGGPYQVIYGVDVFKGASHFKYGETFKPPAEYLSWVAAHLEGGGVFVALNDFRAPNAFTEAEALAAGLTIRKWNEPRQLPAEVRKAFSEMFGDGYGEMTLTILEKRPASP